jgi:hypothetical protein
VNECHIFQATAGVLTFLPLAGVSGNMESVTDLILPSVSVQTAVREEIGQERWARPSISGTVERYDAITGLSIVPEAQKPTSILPMNGSHVTSFSPVPVRPPPRLCENESPLSRPRLMR